MFELSSELRAQLRSELSVMGVSDGDQQIVLDLGVHALNQAAETIGRVASSAPFHLVVATQVVASALLHNVTRPQIEHGGNYRASAAEMDEILRQGERDGSS